MFTPFVGPEIILSQIRPDSIETPDSCLVQDTEVEGEVGTACGIRSLRNNPNEALLRTVGPESMNGK